MSIAQPPIDRRPSPSFAPTNPFASNNPFRNRVSASSPDLPSPSISQSKNPFLDVFADDDHDIFGSEGAGRQAKPNPVQAASSRSQQQATPRNETENLLINLTIEDTDQKQPPRRPSPAMNGENKSRGPQSRPTNGPPRAPGRGPPPPPIHTHKLSGESGAKATSNGSKPRGRDEERVKGRQRSNSDSSALDVDRERQKEKERERRREKSSKKDGDDKSKDDKGKDDKSKKSSRKKTGAPLDIIDKLDVTGIYGAGLFHHDGPFDACNPHRNKNKSRAPMQAFPAGSKNNALGGFDFDLKSNDHSNLFGTRDPEAYLDFAAGRRASAADDLLDPSRPISKRTQSFDPVNRPVVHGDVSLGLGTSTFLEGTPATKKAIEKAQADDEVVRPTTSGGFKDGGGLQRKKSLAQKFRGIGSQKAPSGDASDKVAPGFDRRHKPTKSNSPTNENYPERPFTPTSPPRGGAPPVNRSTKGSVSQPRNGYGDDYDSAWDKKGESIQIAEEEKRSRDRAPSHPGMGRAASDNKIPTSTSPTETSAGGLLKRVKSMSKGKRRDAS